jgi:hypothetical protein
VTEDGPGDTTVNELGDGNFAGEGTIGTVEAILGSDFNIGAKVFASEEEV